MRINPRLGKTDRIGNAAIGVALVTFAFVGTIDKLSLQIGVGAVGLILIVGAFVGT